jgi:hypothetical protein
MSNIHYTKTFDVSPGSKITSQGIEDQFLLIEQGFDSVDVDVAAKLATRDAAIALRSLKGGDSYTGTHDFTGASSVDVPTPAAGVPSSKAANMTALLNAISGLFTSALTVQVVSGTSQLAVNGGHYILTNAAATTLTLPAGPASGDTVRVTWKNNRADNVVARNGQTIGGDPSNLTLDGRVRGTVALRFVDSSWEVM